jgi:hypothetical protein
MQIHIHRARKNSQRAGQGESTGDKPWFDVAHRKQVSMFYFLGW